MKNAKGVWNAWGPALGVLGLVGIPASASAQATPLMTVSASAFPGAGSGATAISSGSVLALGSTSALPTIEALVVHNSGTADLTITQVELADITSCTVSLGAGEGAVTVSPGADSSLLFRIMPQATGSYGFTIRITSNDLVRSPFTIPVTGLNATAVVPVIFVVDDTGARILPGSTLNLGTTPHWTFPLAFSVGNTGKGDLTLGPVAAGALSNCTVVIVQPTITTIKAGEEAPPFHVDVSPMAGKALSFTLTLPNNDPNQTAYVWTIQGNAEPAGAPVDPDAGAGAGFDATGTAGAGGATGTVETGGASGQGGGQAPSTSDAGTVPAEQAPVAPADMSGCRGCVVASSSGPLTVPVMFVVTAMALTRRRRRR